jgi:hypothetical protein
MNQNIFYISKEQSNMLKGMAILFMVFLHLFNSLSFVRDYTPLLYVGDIPFVHWLCRAMNPVAFYLLISGYGLYYSHISGKLDLVFNTKRIFKLYLYWWVCLIIMIPIGLIMAPERFSMSFYIILRNISAINTSWYPQAWFLFPYVLIVFSSEYVFKFLDRIGPCISFISSILLYYGASFLISRHHYCDSVFMQIFFPYFQCLGVFCLGSIFCMLANDKNIIFPKYRCNNTILALILIMLVLLTSWLNLPIFRIVYVILFVLTFIQMSLGKRVKAVLMYMGGVSTAIWLTHSYYCYYIFHDFVFGFKYPLIIFLVTVFCSMITALVINYIINLLSEMLKI